VLTGPSDTEMTKNIVILVPNWSGGIDRLFENIDQHDRPNKPGFFITKFNTHGRSLRGLSRLPFGVVYYSSAVFYTLLLPFRLLKFIFLCLFRKVDICHVNLSTGASTFRKYLFSRVCRLFNVRFVIHLHGGDYRRFFADLPGPLQRMARSLYCDADRVIVLGQLWKDYVADVMGVAPEKISVLPNAVAGPDSISWGEKDTPPRILFLGRLIETKGIAELVDALSDDEVTTLPWTATLAGDGEVASCRARIDTLGLTDRVHLPGWLSSEAVADELRKSSIFVLPSHYENLPLSMLEAMAYGLCPIVTPVGSVEDVIADGLNGIVVPAKDSASLADALLSVLRDDEKRSRMGKMARANFLAHYDYKEYRGKLERIYRSVLSKGD